MEPSGIGSWWKCWCSRQEFEDANLPVFLHKHPSLMLVVPSLQSYRYYGYSAFHTVEMMIRIYDIPNVAVSTEAVLHLRSVQQWLHVVLPVAQEVPVRACTGAGISCCKDLLSKGEWYTVGIIL